MAGEGTPANRSDTGGETVGRPPLVPNHTLLSLIARGSYGEVWLARSELGQLRAVKVVFRSRLANAKPYEREFAGIKRFEPISREHEGFVDILQVGLNEAEGFFFYVMELADAAPAEVASSQCSVISDQSPASPSAISQLPSPNSEFQSANSDPRSPIFELRSPYSATTLLSEIHRLGHLPVDRVLDLGIRLASAMDFLHQKGLVHRDIKPSNIIFINGQPKLADVGLVADLGDPRSFVGTEGYIPPEGPGTAQADLYSLGKVLYEAATGKDRHDFPRLGTALDEAETNLNATEGLAPAAGPPSNVRADQLLELNEILVRAGETEPAKRYASAGQLLNDLRAVAAGRSLRQARARRRQFKLVAAALATCVVSLGLLVGLASIKRHFETRPQILFEDDFDGPELDTNKWTWSYVDGGADLLTGKRTAAVEQVAGELILRTRSEPAKAESVAQLLFVDSVHDFRSTSRCQIEVDLSGSSSRYFLGLAMSSGLPPTSVADVRGGVLCGSVQNNPDQTVLSLANLLVMVIPERQVAVVYPDRARRDQFDVVDLRDLAAWHMRFFCRSVSSAGFPPSPTEVRVRKVVVRRIADTPAVVGRVVDEVSDRPLEDAIIRDSSGKPIAKTSQSGAFLIEDQIGPFKVEKPGYPNATIQARSESDARHLITVRLRNLNPKIGDVVDVIPLGETPLSAIGIHDGKLHGLSYVDEERRSHLFEIDVVRREIRATRPRFYHFEGSFQSFAEVGGRTFGFQVWHTTNSNGVIFDLGRESQRPIVVLTRPDGRALRYPNGCAFDGRLLWFVENDFPDKVFGIHSFDPDWLRPGPDPFLPSSDIGLRALAWDGHRFWVSGWKLGLYRVNRDRAVRLQSVDYGVEGEKLPGDYDSLAYGEGYLWGLELDKKRICKIKTTE